MEIKLYTDGGARGNPGPAAAGAVIFVGENEYHYGVYLGEKTNNQAEYLALQIGLGIVSKRFKTDAELVEVFMDSELIVKQLNGLYKVKDPGLKVLNEEVKKLVSTLPMVKFNHIPREKNTQADQILNEVLDNIKNN